MADNPLSPNGGGAAWRRRLAELRAERAERRAEKSADRRTELVAELRHEATERLNDAAERARQRTREMFIKVDSDNRVVAAIKTVRRRLPGDAHYGDPLSLSGTEPPQLLAQRLATVRPGQPSATKELLFSTLQVLHDLTRTERRFPQEDREVAILFTDLVGFSSWALAMGDDEALDLLRRVMAKIEPEIYSRHGAVVKRLGDGLMAVFLDVDSAVEGALAASAAVDEMVRGADGHLPRLRAGVHVGTPRRLASDYFGVDVNIAARVCAASRPSEVLVSDAVKDRLKPDSGLVTRRRLRFNAKGVPKETTVYVIERGAAQTADAASPEARELPEAPETPEIPHPR